MKQPLNEVKRMQQLAGILTEATTYMAIKDELTSAMKSMGYKKEYDGNENEPTPYKPLSYRKPIGENKMLVAQVAPSSKGYIKPGPDFGKYRSDYNIVVAEMYIDITSEEERKKFFGLVKKKVDTSSVQYIFKPLPLDLTKNTTEEAVDKITSLFKQGEAKAKTL
jgi:hypothetical protein